MEICARGRVERPTVNAAANAFAVQLGRASRRSYSLLRGLTSADSDDALAAAMLAAWERRKEAPECLEDWFMGLLQASVRHVKRSHRAPDYTELKLSQINIEGQLADAQIVEKLPHKERLVLEALEAGYSRSEICAKHGTSRVALTRLISKLTTRNIMRSATTQHESNGSFNTHQFNSDHTSDKRSKIDHDIEKLLRRPITATADCVPCWRCMWFDGYAPVHYRKPQLVDDEIRAAVTAIEARKIEIAETLGDVPRPTVAHVAREAREAR